ATFKEIQEIGNHHGKNIAREVKSITSRASRSDQAAGGTLDCRGVIAKRFKVGEAVRREIVNLYKLTEFFA
ncbi:MAG: hypothetical protein SGJ02_12475, partial [bacterium]|nr:hypothetical protein [bacterium]